jgi:hypothetical protein
MPGLVRASFGCYSTTDDVDRLIEMLDVAAQGTYKGDYRLHAASGEYVPAGWDDPLRAYFSLE